MTSKPCFACWNWRNGALNSGTVCASGRFSGRWLFNAEVSVPRCFNIIQTPFQSSVDLGDCDTALSNNCCVQLVRRSTVDHETCCGKPVAFSMNMCKLGPLVDDGVLQVVVRATTHQSRANRCVISAPPLWNRGGNAATEKFTVELWRFLLQSAV